jgi:hypothetical protein
MRKIPVRRLLIGKAAGVDGIPREFYKNSTESAPEKPAQTDRCRFHHPVTCSRIGSKRLLLHIAPRSRSSSGPPESRGPSCRVCCQCRWRLEVRAPPWGPSTNLPHPAIRIGLLRLRLPLRGVRARLVRDYHGPARDSAGGPRW